MSRERTVAVLVFPKPERLRASAPPSAHVQAWDPTIMSAPSLVTVGIDVAKVHVDVALLSARLDAQRFNNDADVHTALASVLQPFCVNLVIIEATGGYEAELACVLQGAGLPVAVVNPRQD